jgi:predicted kinase
LQAYLDESGDFTDLALLPVYLAYRSLVRAKVALLRDAPDSAAAHIDLAARYLSPSGRSGLVITHGVSGSGKSHQARLIARHHGFIHLRSDLERRRLAGATPSGPTRDPALYSVQHSQATYAYLLAVAEAVLKAGFSVIVDAAFLHRAERVAFAALATRHAAPFHILAPSAERDELEARIVQRQLAGGDPSEATIEVLTRQCAQIEPLTATERVGALADAVALPVALLGRARPH